jgi:CubicO group peptidase (beta-lactamase class C family)
MPPAPRRCPTWTLGTLLIAALVLSVVPAASAQDAALDAAPVDSLARAFKAEATPAGLVVGAASGSHTRIWRYGVASLTDSTRLRPDMRFEIGSITKVFTSLLLAEAVERGALRLDDPIQAYLPDSVTAPVRDGPPITLRHLAAHTSGLPRLPANLAPATPADPYADYTPRKLHAFLEGAELESPPGSTYAYSNAGAGLLGHLLARQADTSFAALLDRRILQPLGLRDTYVPTPGDTSHARFADGHTGLGRPASPWIFDALAGAGAIRSTAPDLLRFLQQHLGPDTTALPVAIRATHRVQHARAERSSVALGWHVEAASDGARLYWHNGGTGGFRSFAAFSLDSNTALVVLVNQAVSMQAFNRFAFRLLRTLHRAATEL